MSVKARQSAESVSSSINAMLSVLDGVTPSSVSNTYGGLTLTLNPFQFVMAILQRIAGFDRIVEFLSETVVYGLPSLESTMKIALLDSMKDLFSCSINPIIGETLINEGVVLDLSSIDLLNVLDRCPLGTENEQGKNNGSFFYFDTERFTIPDQLEKCRDLNAVIWYVKHRAIDRTVWYGYEYQDGEHEVLSAAVGSNVATKASLKDGIITLEYVDNASDLVDSQNNRMPNQSVINNSLHVFIGNTKGISQISVPSSDDIADKTAGFVSVSDKLSEILLEMEEELKNVPKIEEESELQCNIDIVKKIKNALKNGTQISSVVPDLPVDSSNGNYYLSVGGRRVYITPYTYTHTKHDLAQANQQMSAQMSNAAASYVFRTPSENYYYNKSLFEFNTDYITSVKFFDSKVLAAQILDIMTGCLTFGLNLPFEECLIRNEIDKMLQKIVERDVTTTVSDCFFTFTNDEYNRLLDETEKERIGRYTGGTYAYGSVIDYNKIYEELNKVSSSATKSEEVSTFKHAVNEVSRTIKSENHNESDKYSLNYEFLNNLLRGLTLSMVYGIIIPKDYLLMAINLKVMGREPNFDITSFVEMFKSMLINVVQSISDEILVKMRDWLVSLVKELVARLADRLLMEQSGYYIQLLMGCMRAFRQMWGSEDWNMADVEYADIVDNASNACSSYSGTASQATIRNTNC